MDNDQLRHEMDHLMALVQEQMTDFADLQKKQATMTATGTAADDTVQVTVDAQGMVIKTVIDEDYLKDFEFEELGEHVTTAARTAATKAAQQIAELVAPLTERNKELPSMADLGGGLGDFSALIDQFMQAANPDPARSEPTQDKGGWNQGPAGFPTVRS